MTKNKLEQDLPVLEQNKEQLEPVAVIEDRSPSLQIVQTLEDKTDSNGSVVDEVMSEPVTVDDITVEIEIEKEKVEEPPTEETKVEKDNE